MDIDTRTSTQSLVLTVRTRQDILYQDQVAAVSSTNSRGPFDILPLHTHFICLIEKEVVIHEKSGNTRKIPIQQGIMHVEENHVHIYLENWK